MGELLLSFGIFDLFLGRYRTVYVPAIVRDIVVLVVCVIAIFVVLGQRGVDLTSILTTSAVLTAIGDISREGPYTEHEP